MSKNAWIWIAIVVGVLVWKFGRGYLVRGRAQALMPDDPVVLDVRTLGEYQQDHYPGALHIPLQELPNRMDEIGGTDRPVLVYCHSGGRAAVAAGRLRQAGYAKVVNVGSLGNMRKVGAPR